jgi:hypothetical protein
MIGGKPFIEYKDQIGACSLIRSSKGDDFPRGALYPPLNNAACHYKPWIELP